MAETNKPPRRLNAFELVTMIDEARREREVAANAEKNKGSRNEFMRGLSRGVDSMQGTFQGAVGLGQALVGNDVEAAKRFGKYKEEMRQAAENPPTVEKFFSSDPKTGALASPSNMASWAAGSLGAAVPSLAESAISGAAGAAAGAMLVPGPDPGDVVTAPIGLVAGVLSKGAMKKAIATVAEQYVKKGIAKEAAEQMAAQSVRNTLAKRAGAGIAASQATALHESGGMWGEQKEKGIDNPVSALALGQISGVSEAALGAVPSGLRMFIGKTAAAEVARKSGPRMAAGYLWDAVRNAGEEGVQEGFQEFLGDVNARINDPKAKILTKENFMKWAEAGAQGAVVGGLFGTGEAAQSAYSDFTGNQQIPSEQSADTLSKTPEGASRMPPVAPVQPSPPPMPAAAPPTPIQPPVPPQPPTAPPVQPPAIPGQPPLTPEQMSRIASLDTRPSAHKWAEIVLGDRALFKRAPEEAERVQAWEQSRAAAGQATQGGTVPPISGQQPITTEGVDNGVRQQSESQGQQGQPVETQVGQDDGQIDEAKRLRFEEEVKARLKARQATEQQGGATPPAAPQTMPAEEISKSMQSAGAGVVDGMYDKIWNDLQSGSLKKMAKPPLFEQLALKGQERGVVRSVEDLRSISAGMTGDFETDKKVGLENLNKLASKYSLEQKPEIVPAPAKQWKRDERVFVPAQTTASGEKLEDSVGSIFKVLDGDNVVVSLDGDTKYRTVPKSTLQAPDATFEVGEEVGVPWSDEKKAKITKKRPDGTYELVIGARMVTQTADQMVKMKPKEEAKPAAESVPDRGGQEVEPVAKDKSDWVQYDSDTYGLKVESTGVGKAEATLRFDGDTSQIYIDMFAAQKGAKKGSGRSLLRSVVEKSKQYKPRQVSGHFTNPAALGALGAEFGRDNVSFYLRNAAGGAGKKENVTFEEAMQDPGKYLAVAELEPKQQAPSVPMPETLEELESLPKYSVYARKSSDGKKTSYLVRGDGKRGGGDTIHGTLEDAKQEAEREKNREAERKATQDKIKEDEEAAKKKQADYEASFGGFLSDNAMTKGRQLKVLGSNRSYKGKVSSVKEIVESNVANGAVVDDKGRLMSPDGTWLGSDKITKIGIDYARYLTGVNKSEPKASEVDIQSTQEPVSREESIGLTEAFLALPKAGRDAFETEWNRGTSSIKNILYPNNKAYRAEFEARTGVKLPKGVGTTFEAVEKWNAEGRKLVGEVSPPNLQTTSNDADLEAMIRAEFAKQLGTNKKEEQSKTTEKQPVEYSDLAKNAVGVSRTVRASRGGKILLLEQSKKWGTWSVREFQKSNDLAEDIVDFRKAKQVAERIFEGTFDKDGDLVIVKNDNTDFSLSNDKLANEWSAAIAERMAGALRETGIYSNGKFAVRVNDKDRDSILKKAKQESASPSFISKSLNKLFEDGKKLTGYKLNELVVAGYRGGDLVERQVLLRNENSGVVIVDKRYHDSIMKRFPSAKIWSDAERYKATEVPVAYTVNGDVVAVAMIMAPGGIDRNLAMLMDGDYVFPKQEQETEKPKKRTGKKSEQVPSIKTTKTKLESAAEKARREAADLWKELNDLGRSELTSGLNPKLAALAVKVAIAEINANTLTFAAFVERSVANIAPDMLEKLKPYMEKAWEVAHSMGMTQDRGGRFDDFIKGKSDETTQGEPGADADSAMGDGAGKSQGDGTAVDKRAAGKRGSKKDSGRPSDTVLPDDGQTSPVDGRNSGGRVGADGDINADQSEQGRADAVDGERGSEVGAVEDQRAVNHVIGPDDDIAVSSLTKSLSRNIDALRLLKSLETDGRFPNEAERKSLAQYTGWGGLSQALDSIKGERMLSGSPFRDESWENKWGKAYVELKGLLSKEEFQAAQESTENAHYTSKPVIQSLWKIAERMGFTGGTVLELGAGVGHFAGLVPSKVRGQTKFVMVERDSVSSRIAKMLYPRHEVVAGDMEQFRSVPGSVTMGIGNVPFAGGTVADSTIRYKEDLNLHNYSIARHLDAVAPGGVVVVISTHNTLDSNIKQRKFLASKGELIGAIRLPNDAFAENAKTEVVTDVLIFRRPRQGDPSMGVRFDQNVDIKVKNKDGKEVVRSINKYFADNPEMVLGEHSAKGSMYGADEYTVNSTPGGLQSKFEAAIERLPKNILGKVDIAERVVESDKAIPFGRLEIQDGNVVMGFGDKFVSIEGKKFEDFPVHLTGKTGVARARDYIGLRDSLANVRSTMLNETASDDDVRRAQRQLEDAYDSYVDKHGPLNSGKTNIFVRDPDYYRVLALENERSNYNPDTKKIEVAYEKASIFTERVLGPQKEPQSAESAADAVSISAAWKGTIDSAFIGKLLGISAQEAESKLIEDGLAFRNPSTTELELSDLYLSGNVRSKLEQAKISAEEDPQYERNVEALTKVMPKDVPIKKDTVRLGATWIPEHIINAFASQAFGTEVEVSYNANTDAWTVPRVYGVSETAKAKYRTGRVEPHEVLSETLNLRSIKVYDQVATGEFNDKGKPKTTQVLNEKETQAAKHRASVLRADFEKWVLESPEVSDTLSKIYNDRYNNFVRTKYNGEFLVLPGANPEIKLRPYQKDAIWRIINRGTALLAHAVGSGKTYTMIGAAMEMRRLGLARRPLLVVQNATLGQFATSFQKMYPNANVLVANKEDLGKGKRQLFLNKVSTGNWDAVVMAQSTFDNMASDPDVERAFIQDQLDLLEEAIREEGGENNKTPTVKQLVRTKKSLKNRFDSLMGSRSKKEDNVTFEELGADALFLDEAHAYKKPTFTTKLTQLVGLNVTASARSLATTIKVRSIQSASNGRNVILATGTPVTNTLGEAWHMVNYVSPATNAAFSSRTFDQFIANFAQVEPTLTMNAGGQYVHKDAIVKFRNGQQLVEYINDSWDIVTPDALRAYMTSNSKGFPTLRDGQPTAITVDRTPGVAAFMDYIARVYERFKNLPAKERREMSYIPAIAYGASKAATLDIRMVMPGAAEEKNSKLQKAVDEVMRIYEETSGTKGTQLFFSDMKNPFSMSRLRQFMGGETIDAFAEDDANLDADEDSVVDDNESGSFLYQEFKKKLLARGVPPEQIAFIADAKTDKQRQALFERVNNGDIRVLIGSTAKMGVGVNVQKKLAAIHHFDTPWLPADLEQREGRILRFGNENAVVEIIRYAMKKTLDGAIYMSTSRKQKFIWQVLNGTLDGDSFEDPSSASMLSIEEQLAAIQDDPMFFEKIGIQNRLRELELERQSFFDAQRRVASSLSAARSSLDYAERTTIPLQENRVSRVEKFKEDGALDTFSVEIDGKKLTDEKKAAELVKEKVDDLRKYVIKNFDDLQTIARSGGVLSLKNEQTVKFKLGPANVVIGAGPAFISEDIDGKSVTRSTAKIETVVYLDEPLGRKYEVYNGPATVPGTLAKRLETLLDDVKNELSNSLATAESNRKKINELEGLTGKQWEDQEEYDTKKSRLAEIEAAMLESGGSLRSDDNLGNKLNDLPSDLAQMESGDVDSTIEKQAIDIAMAAMDANINSFDKLVAYSVKSLGERRTREIGPYLRLVAQIAGFAGVRSTNDVLGTPGVTREQVFSMARAAFPSSSLSDEQINAALDIMERVGLSFDKVGFAPFGSPVPKKLEEMSLQGGGDYIKGWTSFISATRAIIGATDKADVSTFIHEIAHPLRRFLLNRKVPQSERAGITDSEIIALEKEIGVENGVWKVENEEKFAKMWEQYWFEGIDPPGSGLKGLFQKIARWMQGVYRNIQQITGGPLPSEVRALFDKLVQRSGDIESADSLSKNDDFVTSIKNEVVNELRLRRGLLALEDVATQTREEWLEYAATLLRNDPTLGDRLVKEINSKARNLSNIEVAVMQLYYRQVNNQLIEASDRLIKAKDSGDPVASAQALTDTDIIQNALAEIEEATKKAGREWGRAGVARQIELYRDFSLAALIRKARIANAGNALNEEQLAKIRELAARVAELEGDLAKANQEKLDLERQRNVDAQIEDSKKKGGRIPEAIRKKAVDKLTSFKNKFASVFALSSADDTGSLYATEDEMMASEAKSVVQAYVDLGVFSLGEFLGNIRKDLGAEIPVSVRAAFATAWKELSENGDIPVPAIDKGDTRGLSRLAKQIERSLVEAGITERDDVLQGVWESLQEIDPEISKRETMDALSGYGQYSPPSDNEYDKIIADINAQLLQLSKLQDMEAGIAPAKTGFGRQEPSNELRELIREVNQQKREGKYRVTDEETQLKTAVGSAITALRNRIYDLNKAIRDNEPIVGAQKRDLTGQSEELDSLRKQRDELMVQYKSLFPKPEATMDQRIAATNRVLDRVIADLEEQLRTGEFNAKKQAQPISTPELDAKRARIESLRAQRDSLVGVRKRTPEQIEKAYKANLLKQIADYKERAAANKFDPKPRKEVRTLSQEELALKQELADVKDQFYRMAADYRLANMSPRERAWDYIKETAHLSRALMTSIDASAMFRQGGTVAFAHPMMAKAVAKDMYRAMLSKASEFKTAEEIRNDELYQFAITAGLQITEDEGKITKQEEAYMGRWAREGIGAQGTTINKVSQKLLAPVSASARGYMTFLNGIRFQLFKHLVGNIGRGGQVTADEAKVIAMYINAATGRSDLGPMMKWAEQMNMAFFAPRFVASRFQYLGLPLWLLGSRKVSGRVKKAIAMEYARHAAGVTSFLGLTVALGSLLGGDDEEEKPTVSLDPRSSDFLKIKIGETRIDPMSGLSQVVVLTSRIASGQRVRADGKVVSLRGEDVPYGEAGMTGVIGNFLRSKLAPIPGAALDIATGENVVGQPATPFSSVVNLFVPLSIREIGETAEARGIPQGTLITFLSLHGMGASTYGPESNYRKANPEQRQEQFAKDLKRMEFDSPDPGYKQYLSREQIAQVRQRREEKQQSLVYAASTVPNRKAAKSEESYKQSVSEQKAALEALKRSGITLTDARRLLIKHWESSYGSSKEMRGGVMVYKPALSDRLQQLRKVFAR